MHFLLTLLREFALPDKYGGGASRLCFRHKFKILHFHLPIISLLLAPTAAIRLFFVHRVSLCPESWKKSSFLCCKMPFH